MAQRILSVVNDEKTVRRDDANTRAHVVAVRLGEPVVRELADVERRERDGGVGNPYRRTKQEELDERR